MEKFNRTLRGYDPEEVNACLDKVISQVEGMVNEIREKDKKIVELQSIVNENTLLKEKVSQYERMESSLNNTIIMAQKTSEQVKMAAHQESQTLLEDAKNNANRIVNEALIRAEKTEEEAALLRRNMKIFKKRIRDIIETQLEVVGELDSIEL
jgi:cell division initiation protein